MLNHSKYSELTPAQHEGLGKLFVQWSNLEFLLRLLLSRLLFPPEFLGRTDSDEMGAVRLETAIRNALDIHACRYQHAAVSEEQVNRIRKLIGEVAKCRALRNSFAHFLWMRVSDDKIAGHKMSGKPSQKKKQGESLSITMDELNRSYHHSYSLVEELKKVVLELPEVKEEINFTRHSSEKASRR